MRHLASGKAEIDARLDLHGLRQSEARYRLIHFIRSAHDRGCRVVLVITGKGAR
ncbi:Smr/MutS family protein, partial [Acinetobacter baumannii]